ncbi:MAG TPA: SpoIIE family protein phosphatase [Terracidiphilus sp.]|nr:SpoIIE family protein phosphatase [Terracidiphilus sp.]
MKKLLFLFLAVSACASLPAQTFSLITGREPVTSLDGLWRFHTGDNPAWANPGFDDSTWPLLRSDESWTKQGHFTYSGYAWYRFAVQVVDGSKPLGVLLPRIYTGYQVFANGKLIGYSGSTSPTAAPAFAANPKLFRFLPGRAGPQTIQIAIRVWEYRPIVSWVGGGTLHPGSAAGDPVLLAQRLEWVTTAHRELFVNSYAYCVLAAVVGLAILALFLVHREDREYLWFSVLLVTGAADAILNVEGFLDAFPFLLFRLTDEVLVAISVLAALLFFSSVLKAHHSLLWWIAFVASAMSPLSVAIYYLQWSSVGISYTLQLSCLLPAYVWIIAALSTSFTRKDRSARLLLAPAVLLYGVYIIDSIAYIGLSLGWQNLPSGRMFLLQHPFPLDSFDVVRYIFIFALLLFLMRRFSRARKEEERLASELEAARSVQSLLIPAALPATPGFTVENVYIPASEVGGDFFQVLPDDDGSLLIIVGDVSGKGLQAAMTVSAIVGALRDNNERQPAHVLAHLNRVLSGQISGFATCSAALIAIDGNMTLANAGHLSPYRNGEELPVPGGLPLGLLAEATYDEKHFELAPGDRLTFVSDGVVEARNAKGELLGFERMTPLTTKPAAEIADTAHRWGQEDDITVLTVARAAKLGTVTA